VATELNDRPRKTLGGITPTQAMQRLLWTPNHPSLRRPPEFADRSEGQDGALMNEKMHQSR